MVVGSATPALADSGVIKAVFIEEFQGTTPLDDPTFTACLGYEGQIFEDRDGVFNITVHTRGAMAGAFHVEEVTATFVLSPVEGIGVVYTGTYREHAAGNFMTIDDQDVEYPAGSFYLHATGTGSDGSRIQDPLHPAWPFHHRQANW
jgi:hypothetical protein